MFEDILKKVENRDELTRSELATLVVIKVMNDLVDLGILENKAFEITEKGEKILENIDPPITDEEFETAARGLIGVLRNV